MSAITGFAIVDGSPDSDTVVFTAADPSDILGTHVGPFDYPFEYSVTYDGVVDFENPHDCILDEFGDEMNAIFYISPSVGNSHVWTTSSPGREPICYGNLDCTVGLYQSNCNDLGVDFECYGSLSNDDNAHYGDCNKYLRKICCETLCLDASMQCGENIQLPDLSSVPFSTCLDVENSTEVCCDDWSSCVYGGVCYSDDGDTDTAEALINGLTMTCTEEHWCPTGFYYDSLALKCLPQQEACYDPGLEEYCNSDPSGDMEAYQQDSGCIEELLVPDTVNHVYYEACTPTIVIEGIEFWYYQNVTVTTI